jgi:NADH-quinone oxidoreductase subunit L
MSEDLKSSLKESPFSILLPLVLLAIPAAFGGYFFFHDALHGFFGNSIYVAKNLNVVAELSREAATQSPIAFMEHSVHTLPFWLAISGVLLSYILYVLCPSILTRISILFRPVHWFLVKKYLIDDVYDFVIGKFGWALSFVLWRVIDVTIIDRILVHGSANMIYAAGKKMKKLQTGYIYHYSFIMVLAIVALLLWVVVGI